MGLGGLIIGLLICWGITFLMLRFLVFQVVSARALWKAVIPMVAAVLIFLVIAGFASGEQTRARLPLDTPISSTIAELKAAELMNQYVMFEGVISAENPPSTLQDLATYIQHSEQSLPTSLILTIADGELLLNELRANALYLPPDGEPHAITSGDRLLVLGQPWLVDDAYHLVGDLLMKGDHETFLATYGAQQRRHATAAQIVLTLSFLSIVPVALAPFYRAWQLWRKR
ncbi:MAG: hypothetical protein ACPG8W_16270 [Candidatus Promineifilaceae bacterium]